MKLRKCHTNPSWCGMYKEWKQTKKKRLFSFVQLRMFLSTNNVTDHVLVLGIEKTGM